MADYQGAARSNFFRVKDLNGLRASAERFGLVVQGHPAQPDYVMLYPTSDDGGWPSWQVEGEETGNDVAFDPIEHICPYLAEGQVVILIEAGAEKLNYVSGWAGAYTWDGRHIKLALLDIYERVVTELRIPEDQFADATYLSLPHAAILETARQPT